MTDKLVQKHLLHGKQTLELHDDFIKVTTHRRWKGKKTLDIELAMLNPEPVINHSRLNFHSRVKCGALISLYLNKPNAREFNAFVEAITAKAKAQFDVFAGLKN